MCGKHYLLVASESGMPLHRQSTVLDLKSSSSHAFDWLFEDYLLCKKFYTKLKSNKTINQINLFQSDYWTSGKASLNGLLKQLCQLLKFPNVGSWPAALMILMYVLHNTSKYLSSIRKRFKQQTASQSELNLSQLQAGSLTMSEVMPAGPQNLTRLPINIETRFSALAD